MNAPEVRRAPHLVGVELVGAPELITIASGGIVDTVKERISSLEAKLAVEVVPVRVAHKVEAIV